MLFVEPYGPSFAETATKMGTDPKVQVIRCAQSMDVVTQIADLPCALIVFHAKTPEDFVKHSTVLKLIQPQIKKNRVRIVFNTNLNQVKILSMISYYGTAEIISDPINARAMLFKLQRHVRTVGQDNVLAVSNGLNTPDPAAPKTAQNSPQARTDKRETKAGPKVRYTDAIKLQSDCWLASKASIKQLGRRWVVKMLGPGPVEGVWVKVKSAGQGPAGAATELIWQWKPHLPSGPGGKDLFIKDEGSWIFRGQRPDFQEGAWWFVSNTPDLSFYNGSERLGTKLAFETETGTLLMGKDSLHAARLMPAVRDSIKKGSLASTKTEGTNTNPQNQVRDRQIEWVRPLPLKSDCWLFEEKMPRRINKRWVIRITGPGPSAGRWVEIRRKGEKDVDSKSDNPGERESAWQWTSSDPSKDSFVGATGVWIFHGRQPRFEGDHWLFVADRPLLGFYLESQLVGEKVAIQPSGSLKVAKDSDIALAKMPAIRKSHALATKQAKSGEDKEANYNRIKEAEMAEKSYGSGAAPAATPKDAEFRMPKDAFGDPEGIWEKCNAGQGGRVWSVFVPSAWMNGPLTLVALEAFSPFFVYKGKKMPYLDEPKIKIEGHTGEWIFLGTEPKRYESFAGLPSMVQEYLKSLVNAGPKPELNLEGREFDEEVQTNPEVVAPQLPGDVVPPEVALEGAAPVRPNSNDAVASNRPRFSELGLYFMAAELSQRLHLGVDEAARRMARYLSKAAHGARVEIWLQGQGQWALAAASDGNPGLFQESLKHLSDQPLKTPDGFWIAPLFVDGKRMGCMVWDQKAQEFLTPEFARAASGALKGLGGALLSQALVRTAA